MAARNQYPAIDVLQSISRVMIDVVDDEHHELASQMIEVLASYEEAEDLINIGAYVKGSNPRIDRAISLIDQIRDFLKQGIKEEVSFENSIQRMREILG